MNGEPHTPADQAAQEIETVVRAIVARKLRVSFYRPDLVETQNAMDIVNSVLVEVLQRMRSADTANLEHPREYAAVVAYHSCAEYLRQKRAPRRRLQLKLQYFLSHHPDFAIWETAGGEKACGYARWQTQPPADSGRIAVLLAPGKDAPDIAAIRDVDDMGPKDWEGPLRTICETLQAPLLLADLLVIVGGRALPQAAAETEMTEMGDSHPSPEEEAGLQELLHAVWQAIAQIQIRWRRAFLLNPPRGFEIEIFPANGVATVEEIGAALAIAEKEYEILWNALAMDPQERGDAAGLAGAQRFAVLWRYLPLRDAVIALILGKDAQYVINLRRLARDELAARLREKKIQ